MIIWPCSPIGRRHLIQNQNSVGSNPSGATKKGTIMKRPKLIDGDLVRLSKKGKRKYIKDYHNLTMIVDSIEGDGVDSSSRINVVSGSEIWTFRRDELWKTGFNVYEYEEVDLSIDAPINNNGLDNCYVCEMPTKTIRLLSSEHQICSNAQCVWFEN